MGILDRFKIVKDEPVAAQPVVVPVQQAKPESSPLVVVSDVIVRPLVTEKAAVLASANTYAFIVKLEANRIQVKHTIKQMYGVMPARVNIQNVEGKSKRFGHSTGKRSDWKKAFVTLPAGKTINVHEGV